MTARRAFVPFPEPRILGTFLARRQRFFADVLLEGGASAVAHCPNTGSMKGCLFPGHRAVLWDSQNPLRRLRYTWKAVEADGFWVGVDTSLPNRLTAEAIKAGLVPGLQPLDTIQREVRFGENSRVDLLVKSETTRCFVEVKNVTLVENGVARFPDAPTERGLRHLRELSRCVSSGDRAAMVYVVQREDGRAFEPAADIDPSYAEGLALAAESGVEIYALATRVSPEGVEATGLLPHRLPQATVR